MKGFNFDFVKMVEDKEKAIKNEMRYCIKRALELRCPSWTSIWYVPGPFRSDWTQSSV